MFYAVDAGLCTHSKNQKLFDLSSRSPLRHLPSSENERHNFVHTDTVLDLGKDGWPVLSHSGSISIHDREVCTNDLRQIRFIDDEQVGLCDSWSSYASSQKSDAFKRGHEGHEQMLPLRGILSPALTSIT